jgi:hypothetical protein
MKNTLLVLLMFVPVVEAEDFFYFEVSQGMLVNDVPILGHNDWVGDYPTAFRFGYNKDLPDNMYVKGQFEHISSFFNGKPFNDNEENTIDWVHATIGWKF